MLIYHVSVVVTGELDLIIVKYKSNLDILKCLYAKNEFSRSMFSKVRA